MDRYRLETGCVLVAAVVRRSALGGIGFTMSLFIASVALPDKADYAAAKIAIFVASLIAGGLGVLVLWPRLEPNDERGELGRPDQRRGTDLWDNRQLIPPASSFWQPHWPFGIL